jgi:xylulokinase
MTVSGLFAGLDVSTQSCKLVVIDLAADSVIHVDSVNYDRDLPHYETHDGVIQGLPEGVSESDPHMWVEAVDTVLQRLQAAPYIDQRNVRCISVSGQQHGLVALDGEGNLTRPHSKLWNDFSTAEECRLLTERVGGVDRMIEEVGNTQRTGYTAPKILHMRRHGPGCYADTAILFLVHNFINWYLTGGPRGGVAVMEPGDTSGMALWNPVTREWSDAVVAAIDPALRDKLPPVEPSDKIIGTIAAHLAERFDLSPECTVDAGSGDNMYGAIGTGNLRPSVVTISLGSSGTAYAFMEEPYVDPTGEIACFCDSTGNYLPLLCVSNMANGYDAVLATFDMTHAEFSSAIQQTSPGNDGRVLVPWYVGERTPDLPNAAPVYFGFGVDDFSKERLSRAVLEGHVLNLYSGFSRLPVDPGVIHLTGGLSQSPVWCQTIADVFEVETVAVQGEGAALGAAIHAAWVWLKEDRDDLPLADVADPFIVLDDATRRQPVAEHTRVYRVQKQLFRALADRVRGIESADPFALRAELLQGAN